VLLNKVSLGGTEEELIEQAEQSVFIRVIRAVVLPASPAKLVLRSGTREVGVLRPRFREAEWRR
jgi:hypothetical protein